MKIVRGSRKCRPIVRHTNCIRKSIKIKRHRLANQTLLPLRIQQLLNAASTNNVDKLRTLLEAGLDPNSMINECRSALHIACTKGYIDIVEILLEFGADPNIRDMVQNTPLHLAIFTSNMHVIRLLINAGANILLLDMHGKTPLQLAESKLLLWRKSWMNGDLEMAALRAQVKQVVDFMISLWKGRKYTCEDQNNTGINDLEQIKLSINESTDEQMDQLLSKVSVGLQHIKID